MYQRPAERANAGRAGCHQRQRNGDRRGSNGGGSGNRRGSNSRGGGDGCGPNDLSSGDGCGSLVVEAHAVDEGAVGGEAEEARARIAGLGMTCDGAHLDEAEAKGGQGRQGDAVFVEGDAGDVAHGKEAAGDEHDGNDGEAADDAGLAARGAGGN